jgi:hypothetical protein
MSLEGALRRAALAARDMQAAQDELQRRVGAEAQSMKPKHQPCPCGCGEMADECGGRNPNPLGAFTLSDFSAIPCGVLPNVSEMHFLDADGNVHTVSTRTTGVDGISGKSNHP